MRKITKRPGKVAITRNPAMRVMLSRYLSETVPPKLLSPGDNKSITDLRDVHLNDVVSAADGAPFV